MNLHSYSKIYNLGHPEVAGLFNGHVVVQEKVDGSQFSFGVDPATGEVHFRSKGAQIYAETKDKLFRGAIDAVLERRQYLSPGYVYRGEVLCRPKHNTLEYGRVPKGNVILFDVDASGEQWYVDTESLPGIAEQLDLECVPTFFTGEIHSAEALLAFLDRESVLGGPIEGVVVKNYKLYGTDKKVLMGKHVREAFKEAHTTAWKSANPTRADVVETIGTDLRTDARFRKAVEHLRDAGRLTSTPKDIGPLLKELQEDLGSEMKVLVAERLLKHFWPQIVRIATSGFPEWYKNELLQQQFAADSPATPLTSTETA